MCKIQPAVLPGLAGTCRDFGAQRNLHVEYGGVKKMPVCATFCEDETSSEQGRLIPILNQYSAFVGTKEWNVVREWECVFEDFIPKATNLHHWHNEEKVTNL